MWFSRVRDVCVRRLLVRMESPARVRGEGRERKPKSRSSARNRRMQTPRKSGAYKSTEKREPRRKASPLEGVSYGAAPRKAQKERSPGVSPGFVWFRVPKEAPGITRRPRWWGSYEGPAGSGTTRLATGNSVCAPLTRARFKSLRRKARCEGGRSWSSERRRR
jgi:hypothetical protein